MLSMSREARSPCAIPITAAWSTKPSTRTTEFLIVANPAPTHLRNGKTPKPLSGPTAEDSSPGQSLRRKSRSGHDQSNHRILRQEPLSRVLIYGRNRPSRVVFPEKH